MPWNGRRDRETQRPPDPGPKRPSNPSMVAKARGPAKKTVATPEKAPRASKKGATAKAKPALPASVTMSTDRVLRGETLPAPMETPGTFWGVLYKLVVSDANGRPIAPGSYRIRKHLLHVASSGALAQEERGARISVVALDEGGASYDFSGAPLVAEMPHFEGESRPRGAEARAGKDELFEYFSFELQGVSYAIPQSGFVLARSLRGHRLLVSRTPQAGGSIHGAVVQGFVTEGGGDAFSIEVA